MSEPIVLSGGTGLIGGALLRRRSERGEGTRALVRRAGKLAGIPHVEEVEWDGVRPPAGALSGARGVVHLSGEPVFGGIPTAARKKRLYDSRIDSTKALVAAMAAEPPEQRPAFFVCASAVGYYGDRGDEVLDEAAAPGEGLLADLCVDWEAAAAEAEGLGVRVCSVRIGIVLAGAGGALPLMAQPFRFGLGGKLGSGKQWFPWIHQDDVVGILEGAIAGEDWRGSVNAVAPESVRNEELTKTLGRVLGRPTFMAVPGFAVKAALGELSAELLGSRRVEPKRAKALGYAFAVPGLEEALRRELA